MGMAYRAPIPLQQAQEDSILEGNNVAEILIKAAEVPHFNPNAIHPGWYRPGDPVVVFEDGHPWGAEERRPTFYVFKMPGVPVEVLKDILLEEIWDRTDPENPSLLLRRRRRLAQSKIPASILNALRTTGEASMVVPPIDARGYFEEKA